MIISGPGRKSEQMFAEVHIRGSDYISFVGSIAVGVNLRGFLCFLDIEPDPLNLLASTTRRAPFGQSAFIGHSGSSNRSYQFPRNPILAPLGVLASDIVIGEDTRRVSATAAGAMDNWGLVQTYGYCDRILFSRATYVQNDEFIFDDGSEFGIAMTFSADALQRASTLSGIATIDTSGATASLDLSGTATATVTWGPEILTDGGFAVGGIPQWSVTGNFAKDDPNDQIDFVFAGAGFGTLTQTAANFANQVTGGRRYRLTYTVGVTTPLVGTIQLNAGVSTIPITLDAGSAGTKTVEFMAAYSPSSFIISVAASAGNFTLDSLSVVELPSARPPAAKPQPTLAFIGYKETGSAAALKDMAEASSHAEATVANTFWGVGAGFIMCMSASPRG